MARIRRELSRWPAWLNGPNGERKIFQSEADVPEGWTREQKELFVPVAPVQLSKDDLIAQLQERGVNINPIWGSAHLKKVLDDSSSTR